MKKIKPIKRRRSYKANERKERLRIFELYDGPATDTAAAVRHMEVIHKWIKTGQTPEIFNEPSKKPVARLIDKNP